MHAGQQARFTPHHTATEWHSVDSVHTTAPGERTMFVSSPAGRSRDSGWVRFADDGGVNDARYFFAPHEPHPGSSPGAEARRERNRLFRGFARGDYLRLPEFRLHQLVPRFSAARMAAGERWSDTIAIAVERDGYEQRVDGRRVSTIIGDTVVAGRRLHIVRASAYVQYHERWLRAERTLDTLVVTERDAAGVVVGRYLYDPDMGLFRVREDSTRLSGTAVLRYPDGRSFRTPARYERTRRIDLYDADEYVARREELRVASRAESGGILIQPSTPVEEKLAAGDTLLRDSLLDVLRTTRDADVRQSLWDLLRRWWRGDDDFAALLDRAADVDADTTYLIRTLQRSYNRGALRQFDETTVRRSLPFMADPSLVFRRSTPTVMPG